MPRENAVDFERIELHPLTRAVVVHRQHKRMAESAWGFDCSRGFAAFMSKESALNSADRYNSGDHDWVYWPIAETTLL